MNRALRRTASPPMLVDRAARYFGTASRMFAVRAHLPGQGFLALSDSDLVYTEPETGMRVDIPLDQIQGVVIGIWHEASATQLPVLRVTYRGNLVFGVHVAEPARWAEAMEDLASRGRLPRLDRASSSHHVVPRGMRLLIAVLLVLVLALGALPQALSRLGPRGPATLALPPGPAHPAP